MYRKKLLIALLAMLSSIVAHAQRETLQEGKCDNSVGWTFDGRTLTLEKLSSNDAFVSIPDYDLKNNLAPWIKRGFQVKKVKIGNFIERIGVCAFANCEQLETVEFANDKVMAEIGWGAFLNCKSLFNFSIPVRIRRIGKIAFANCSSLPSVKIPGGTHVEDYAFLSCSNLNVVEIASTAVLGKAVFATEVKEDGKVTHRYYDREIRGLPSNVNEGNSKEYGLSSTAVERFLNKRARTFTEEVMTSSVDTIIPLGDETRYDTYALVIGNQAYRFVPDVPYANHDAKIFAEYCKKTLGIPAEHVHVALDATKHMLLEQEIGDWITNEIPDKSQKKLIIYYAGHGVPDIHDNNKSYLLPTDVYGTKPRQGIALDDFYAMIGGMGFGRVTIFMDACFSGITRDNESVNDGLRGTEVMADPGNPKTGNLIVFSAAQGNETAQGYQEQGHGLFTFYLLRELQISNGFLSYGRLANSLKQNVSNTSQALKLRKRQTPTTAVSEDVSSGWKKERL